jgi:hypothetical protein
MTTTPRPKLGLKPSERDRAVRQGLLGGLGPIAPEPAGAPIGTGTLPDPRPEAIDAATGHQSPPGPVPEAKPTLVQQLCADFGVDWLPYPLAIGVGQDKPREVRQRLGLLVRRRIYLFALAHSPSRFHPDGSIAGPVSDEHRAWAAVQLEHLARKKADEVATREKTKP